MTNVSVNNGMRSGWNLRGFLDLYAGACPLLTLKALN